MSELNELLGKFRAASVSEREKGTYFEELILAYLRNEATFRDLYSRVYSWAEWAPAHGFNAKDDGIDLVAEVDGTGEVHAIQCKFYDPDYKLQKKDIDSFFTASGRKPFVHRVIVSTTNHWSEHAENALVDQQPPVSKIDLHDLEASQIDWAKYQSKTVPVLKKKKTLRAHQESALLAVTAGLKEADRGKLIMACGTGKTFTSLKIAEAMAGTGKRVLFLVPSLSLLSQTLTEWTQESDVPLHSFAVCSDSDVGKKKGRKEDDAVQTFTHELRYPATTNARSLALGVAARHDNEHMTVVFSTYHSIGVIHDAQQQGLADFDLIVCDEAHRTTGATFDGDDESAFVRIHDAAYVRSAKRIYMTATPRIYADTAKAVAERDNVALYSMDNEAWYGKQLYLISFSEAVKRGLLVDYKVIVLAVEERHINRKLQGLLKDENNSLRVDDAAKIVGCWKALAKLGIHEDGNEKPEPMKRAVAFCQVIEPGKGSRAHKVSSKEIAGMFQQVVEAYQDAEDIEEGARLTCEARHVDGGMNATEKEDKLDWLKAPAPPETCRVLSNVRCLSEGVDVPALDAVLFLTPRNSQVDVVQSVGRVMRNAPGKKRGYVVLPVVIPAGVEPHEALNDNQTYKVVWQVLQALRSHDDRFDAMVNKLDLIGPDRSKMEVIAIADNVQRKTAKLVSKADKAKGKYSIGETPADYPAEVQGEFEFEVGEIERALYAKVVDRCGNRRHWEQWADDIARIAQTHIDRIRALLEDEGQPKARAAFEAFAGELRDDLNDKVSDGEIIEMLAQHLITKPVFEALFANYSFASNNPMSQAMQQVLDVLETENLQKESTTLQEFYASVKMRAEGIDNATGKQKIIVELYDKFFANAFPKLRDKLGIVYTPVEVVDFILHSVNHLLQQEFGQTLGSKGVHILDPFTGTGTFITRLLQSGLIKPEELAHKYRHEIHANELVLLAYYIAAINIEATYHGLAGGDYVPFEGILLTDTFQMYEKDDLVDALLVDNSKRRKRQKKLDIRIIVGNPPYSVGQASENDFNANVNYECLDGRIHDTYVKLSSQRIGKKSTYDSYLRAMRWASDRLGEQGVIGYVSGSSFVEKFAMDGVRRAMASEFSSIHVLNMRGDIRKNMLSKGAAKEGQNIFGSGSMTGIAITLFARKPGARNAGIFYRDIGDDLSTVDKLRALEDFGGIAGVQEWVAVSPDGHGDWIKQRSEDFGRFAATTNKGGGEPFSIFAGQTFGANSARDAWCCNSSMTLLITNMRGMIDVYNLEVDRFAMARTVSRVESLSVDTFVESDPSKISWGINLKNGVLKSRKRSFEPGKVVKALYRPFTKRWFYADRHFNHSLYKTGGLFPTPDAKNLYICVSGVGARSGFSALISDAFPNYDTLEKGVCLPRWIYVDGGNGAVEEALSSVVDELNSQATDAISDDGLDSFRSAYFGEKIGKEDLFYYVYGILHSSDYRERYADNLSKELPRIPHVRAAADFWHFSKAGRALADLHLNYETVEKYPLTIQAKGLLTDADYRVEKMKFAKKKDSETGKSVNDRSTVIYNTKITMTGIPEAAWDYVVNGKAALDWVMERQAVRVDKASGIVNDANDWAIETMGNPRHPLELFQRVVTVSLETLKIVNALPALDVLEN